MKKFNMFFGIAATSLSLLTSIQSHAGAGGHGGDTIVCFSVPLSQAVEIRNGSEVMTAIGRRSITSVRTIEFFRAEHAVYNNPFVQRLSGLSYREAVVELRGRFDSVPSFGERLLRPYSNAIGFIEDTGYPAVYGLEDVRDSGAVILPPPGCAQIQAAIRQGYSITYDSSIWAAAPPLQKALLQMHEELFAVGVHFGHEFSVGTQLVLMAILASNVEGQSLSKVLQAQGFGARFSDGRILAYMSKQEMVNAKIPIEQELAALKEIYFSSARQSCEKCDEWYSQSMQSIRGYFTNCPFAAEIEKRILPSRYDWVHRWLKSNQYDPVPSETIQNAQRALYLVHSELLGYSRTGVQIHSNDFFGRPKRMYMSAPQCKAGDQFQLLAEKAQVILDAINLN
jgi:hypothetical protein